jgi:dihydrofolate reductase
VTPAKITLIAALSQNGVIGKDGVLPWRIPEDLRFFKEKTLGKPVIFGSKTFDICLQRRVLPGRLNLVLTSRREQYRDLQSENLLFFPDLNEALQFAEEKSDEVMIAGGENVYRQTLPLCDEMYLTRVRREIEGDTHFPDFDASEFESEVIKISEDADLPFTIEKYCRRK